MAVYEWKKALGRVPAVEKKKCPFEGGTIPPSKHDITMLAAFLDGQLDLPS